VRDGHVGLSGGRVALSDGHMGVSVRLAALRGGTTKSEAQFVNRELADRELPFVIVNHGLPIVSHDSRGADRASCIACANGETAARRRGANRAEMGRDGGCWRGRSARALDQRTRLICR